MPSALPPLARLALSLAAQGLVYWTVLALLGPGAVRIGTWLVLHLLLAAGIVLLHSTPRAAAAMSARTWLAIALLALYSAAFFAGANFALDALHGAQRVKAELPAQLGGLELWQFLCPGVFSLGLGALVGRRA